MNFLLDPIPFVTEWLRGLLLGFGLSPEITRFILYLTGSFILATGAMLLVTMLIWAERKIIGRIQDRLGPNRVGPWGIIQTGADMLKIFAKEHITPQGVDLLPYNIGPVVAVAAVLAVWAVLPFSVSVYGVDLNVGVLFIVAVGGLGELAVVLAGWGSNNKFALLGSFRAVAQLISYEVPLVMALLIPAMFAGSMGMASIVQAQTTWYIFLAPVAALIFFITSVAEIGRAPFDLVEAESELVAGFNVEYSGLKFGMFYVADFLHAFTVSLIFSTLFLGGWRGPLAEQIPVLGFVYYILKTSVVYFLIIWLRASLPRFRIDQMMDFNWKFLTPLSLGILMVTALAIKVLPENTWIRVGVMLAINAAVFWAADSLLGKHTGTDRVTSSIELVNPQPESSAGNLAVGSQK